LVVAEAEEAEGQPYTCDLVEGEGEEVPSPVEVLRTPVEVLSPVENLEW
jgi:hypothetical protein